MRDSHKHGEAVTMRTASGPADFHKLRDMLIESWPDMPPFYNWEPRRLDGAYFHTETPGWPQRWGGGAGVGLWEIADGRLVAAVHPEGSGDCWLELRRGCDHLADEMLEWAETNLARENKQGRLQLAVFCWDYDQHLQAVLAERGYTQTEHGDVVRCRPYEGDARPPLAMPAGYKLHEVRPGHSGDSGRYAALLNAAFRRTFHTALEVATFTSNSPSFRSDLELVAVAPDGSFAALAGMTYDAANRVGSFEPVCATPEPRPLGLTATLLDTGWHRVRALGARHCYVGTGIGMAANRFYEACGFKVIHSGHYWRREL